MNARQIVEAMKTGDFSAVSHAGIKVYEKSSIANGPDRLVMIKHEGEKYLIAAGGGSLYNELSGEEQDGGKICPLTHDNRLVLNKYFPFTVPRSFGKQTATIGLGDRLGLASPGHIQTVRGREIKPILAQQSIRELNLTGRNYEQVIDAACFAVFQEGYQGGFGADGDHLKLEADIQMALGLGFSMLTLDCSDKIDNTIDGLSEEDVRKKYAALAENVRSRYEAKYKGKTFQIGDQSVHFTELNLMQNVLIYNEAIRYMIHIYETYVKPAGRDIDFEISIDETLTPTAPHAHYFVAKELYDQGVDIFSMAPRFCGEFQKGIDYIGDLRQFEQEFVLHIAIADHFGYKLSIHSGSDKFSVFPIIGKYTKGRFHIKTAGTNWLEAVRTVARVNPGLYREMHAYALQHFTEATAYYHVTTDITRIKPLAEVSDAELPDYMNDNNARQMIHITYGILLLATDEAGKSLFKERFFRTLIAQEEAYDEALRNHIGRHLDLLGK